MNVVCFHLLEKLGMVYIDYRDYVYGTRNGLILQDTPPNTWPQYTDMGIGHECPKIYLKWLKLVDINSFMIKTAGLSLSNVTLLALYMYLSYVSKKAKESHNRKGDKIQHFTKLSEPCFQIVWLCNTVLSNLQRFKRCLCKNSTKHRQSDVIKGVASHRHLLVEGDKISYLPQTSHFDEQTHAMSSSLLFEEQTKASDRRMISQEQDWPCFWLWIAWHVVHRLVKCLRKMTFH